MTQLDESPEGLKSSTPPKTAGASERRQAECAGLERLNSPTAAPLSFEDYARAGTDKERISA
jgi:hypothetical protein